MNIKDGLALAAGSLMIGWMLVHAEPETIKMPLPAVDTVVVDILIEINVKNKTALFIGDSHTANHTNGWQRVLSNRTGFNMINASVSGKTTYWMLEQAVYRLTNKIDYCFIYGGANDMYSNSITVKEAVENIKGIARICNKLGVKCVVLTGFDAIKCTRTSNPKYPYKYTELQKILLTEGIEGAKVVDTRVVARTDCWDGLCHMTPAGHKKVAEKVIKDLHFQEI